MEKGRYYNENFESKHETKNNTNATYKKNTLKNVSIQNCTLNF